MENNESRSYFEKIIDKTGDILSSLWDKITRFFDISTVGAESHESLKSLSKKVSEEKGAVSNSVYLAEQNILTGMIATPANLKNLQFFKNYYSTSASIKNINTGTNCVTSVVKYQTDNNICNIGKNGKEYTYLEYAKTDYKNSYVTYFEDVLEKKSQKLSKINTIFVDEKNNGKQFLLGLKSHGGIITIKDDGTVLFSHSSPNFIRTKNKSIFDFTSTDQYKKAYAEHKNKKSSDKTTLTERVEKYTNLKRRTSKNNVSITKIDETKIATLTINGKSIVDTIDFSANQGGFHTVLWKDYVLANQNSTKNIYLSEMCKKKGNT